MKAGCIEFSADSSGIDQSKETFPHQRIFTLNCSNYLINEKQFHVGLEREMINRKIAYFIDVDFEL